VLRLVADGDLGLDEPANRYLGAVRLADDEVTVRQLLSHAGGVSDSPAPPGPAVRELAAVAGPVIACDGRRGAFRLSPAGYAALGEIVTAVSGQPYQDAVSRLVLQPLDMSESRFATSWPTTDSVVTCYDVGPEGVYEPVADNVPAFLAVGGLWSTAADLARFGLGWRALLPRPLAEQAIRPHVPTIAGAHAGLGWLVNEPLGVYGQVGGGAGGAASLILTLDGRRAHAAMASRLIPIEPVNAAVMRAEEDR
jgi:CubicO group peptidase (beta-lactamase class C family)